MAIEDNNIFLHIQNQHSSPFERARIWVHEHPTTIKILKIAGLILGIGLLAFVPFAIPFGNEVTVGLAVSGAATTIASLILFAGRLPILPNTNALEHQAAKPPRTLPTVNLWLHLEQKSQAQLKGLEFLSKSDLNHRFSDIRCPRKTAVSIAGQYLHANKVGGGVAQRAFVASQAPLVEDYEIFWKAIFEGGHTIFDLTTIKDQMDGGVTKYYPDELNKTMKYGSMSVKLIEVSGHTYTYQIKNAETLVVKNIKRYHYADWKDFGAVSLSALGTLIQNVETLSPNPKDLVWIHCRAGVGRTGTLITALVLKEKIECGEIDKENLVDSLEDIIVELRKQRGFAFVQQEAQLDLLRQYADSLIESFKENASA